MLLRDFLNEFELDWAQAAVRSGQIPQRSLKGARILLAGDQMELQEAIAWSFMAWNDEKHSDVKVAEAAIQADGTLTVRVCLYQRRGQQGRAAVFCVPDECMAHAFHSKNTRRLRWQNIRQWKRNSH